MSDSREHDRIRRLEREVRRLRTQNRNLVDDLDYAEAATRVLRRLVGRLLAEKDARP